MIDKTKMSKKLYREMDSTFRHHQRYGYRGLTMNVMFMMFPHIPRQTVKDACLTFGKATIEPQIVFPKWEIKRMRRENPRENWRRSFKRHYMRVS